MIQQRHPDEWTSGVTLLAQHVVPTVSSSEIYEYLGVGALYVMSEEWWDPSVIAMHPRMPVGFVPALMQLRQRQLQRLTALGIQMHMRWYRADDAIQLSESIATAMKTGHVVGVFGVAGMLPMLVEWCDASSVTGRDYWGNPLALDIAHVRAPAGVTCVSAIAVPKTKEHPDANLHWLRYLLSGLPTIAFDTPRHPLRDWQVWHIGADAFAVAALSAETAAPLAIVSDNVARIIHAYMWRIDVLHAQLLRMHQSRNVSVLSDAIDACHDARFFMNFVAQSYPLTVERRALTLAEGALIAETCRDTRQVLKSIAQLLNEIV